MAKQIAGVSEKLLECAVAEFLEKGYKDASLRTIAEKAGTSTSSIYVRFHDKEGLFTAIVEPVVQEFTTNFVQVQENFHSLDRKRQEEEMEQYSSDQMLKMVDYMYDHHDVFRLLLDASYGTKFQNFVDSLVAVEEDYTYKWIQVTGHELQPDGSITRELYHMVVTSYFEGIFQVIRHEIGREEAKRYVLMLGKYHHAGFQAIAGE